VRGYWEGIPGEWIDDDTAIDGRRFVATLYGERKLRALMKQAAGRRCEECEKYTHDGQRHHVYGRGFGGGKREDRPEVQGIRFVVWLCGSCHHDAVIKRWGSWPKVHC